jgi:hypothetical protein
LYYENYKTLLKESKRHSVKMAMLLKLFYRLNATPVKILVDFFSEIGKLIPKFLCKSKRPKIAKNLEKE